MASRPSQHQRTLRVIHTPDDPIPDRLLTAKQVAGRLNMALSTVYLMAARNALPTVRFAGSHLLRFSERAIAEFVRTGGAR